MAKAILVRTNDRRLAARAVEAGFTQFIADGPLPGLGRVDVIERRGDLLHRDGSRLGAWVSVGSRADEARVRRMRGQHKVVVVETRDWKVIPLENLIAALGGKTLLWAVAGAPEQARLFLHTLERGVDGVIVTPRNAKDLARYTGLLDPPRAPHRLEAATITRIEEAGVGERVCVDTTSLFRPGEGLLVGSAAHGFFLVAAETLETEFVAARPFRVNAGAVHSYVLDGAKTRYLSELRSGTTVEAVDRNGHRRSVVVGRAKIETRPMLLVEAQAGRSRLSLILQNAETIRLSTPRGTKSVSELRLGDKVLVHRETGARHFGMKIEERIREQ